MEKLNSKHGPDLYNAYIKHDTPNDWVYLPYGPYQTEQSYQAWVDDQAISTDPFFYAIVDPQSGTAIGIASYLRIDPSIGSIEVGHIHFSPSLQGTPAATEAMFLMMKQAFDLGYRRYEWKCDALNARSRNAALRLGFEFEGIFRQATMYKGRNRDTAWFSVIDTQWENLNTGFLKWLDDSNFDSQGVQLRSLASCRN